jgi:hypothetical protein
MYSCIGLEAAAEAPQQQQQLALPTCKCACLVATAPANVFIMSVLCRLRRLLQKLISKALNPNPMISAFVFLCLVLQVVWLLL